MRRVGIISDIHSNLEALDAALKWLDSQSVEDVVCLGDVVGYGPNPNECCDLVRRVSSVTLLGNHDAAVIGAMSTEFYRDAARHAIQWTRRQLSSTHLEWLYRLPYTHRRPDDGIAFCHSAPISPSNYFYVVFKDDAQAHFRVLDRLASLSLFGHSHLIRAFALAGGKATETDIAKVKWTDGTKFLVSVGSVGQPRDRDPRGAVSFVDLDNGTIQMHRFEYDKGKTARKIVQAGLEPHFGERLMTGS